MNEETPYTDMCNHCTKRSICRSLCPEAEAYANQDQVEWEETPRMYTLDNGEKVRVFRVSSREDLDDEENQSFTPTEKKVLHLLGEGNTRDEIAQQLDISRDNLRKVISNLRKKAK
jgi:DNA-binding NarL/FixJ family response regulator